MSKKDSNIGIKERPSVKDNIGDKPKDKDDIKKPPMYKVVLHNDDYTSMEFVVNLLVTVFHLSKAAAFKTMLRVHHNGKGIAGVFTHEIAETKMIQSKAIAQKEQFPLEVTIESE